MSDSPREPEQQDDSTGPAGRYSYDADPGADAGSHTDARTDARDDATDPGASDEGVAAGRAGSDRADWPGDRAARRRWRFEPVANGSDRQRRRRRWFVLGISAGAALVAIALCAGVLSALDSVDGAHERAAEAQEARRLRETGCLDLERRLNKLNPPGATPGPKERATAIRDENAAVRIYVGQLRDGRAEDAWRQLLDARTVFADALDRQAAARTPAFYVAPRGADGVAVSDQLVKWSPPQCAGPVRRLAAPDL